MVTEKCSRNCLVDKDMSLGVINDCKIDGDQTAWGGVLVAKFCHQEWIEITNGRSSGGVGLEPMDRYKNLREKASTS